MKSEAEIRAALAVVREALYVVLAGQIIAQDFREEDNRGAENLQEAADMLAWVLGEKPVVDQLFEGLKQANLMTATVIGELKQ